MQCRCGNSIDSVPEHLQDLATWICQKCSNPTPRAVKIPPQNTTAGVVTPAASDAEYVLRGQRDVLKKKGRAE